MQPAKERAGSEPRARQGEVRPGVAGGRVEKQKGKKAGSQAGPQVTSAPP